jgi:D-xylose 1-dehydrogenase
MRSSGAIFPDLEGKVVIITGGGSGIGAAIVAAFARQKAKVAFLDIATEPSLRLVEAHAAKGCAVHFEHCDLRDIAALQRAFARIAEQLGPASILINNAAHDERHPTDTVTPEQFDDRIAVNLRHAFFAAQAVLPGMKASGGGAIVNFSSISWMAGMGGMAVYTAAKSAMVGLTRSLARDYGPHNIRVNAVAPGWVRTERQVEKWLTPESDAGRLQAQCLKRWVEPEDIARFVVFLSSEDASACTAQHYVVDAGWV